jgi:hypothetical protein
MIEEGMRLDMNVVGEAGRTGITEDIQAGESTYNRGGGGGGPGPTSSHSSYSGGGGQGVPYDNVTSPSLPPLPLHFFHNFLIQTNNSMVYGFCVLSTPTTYFWSWSFTNNIRIYHHYHIFKVILISNKCHLRYHLIF